MKSIEIEIQVQVEKIKPLENFLKKNAKFEGEYHQIDEYFTPAHRNFIAKKPTDEWLRLRNANGKFSINYKNWHHDKDGKSHHCDEHETEVVDINKMRYIFESIDIKPIVVVDKIRKIYRYKKYEIALDEVKKLGDFVEIEYKGKATKKDASKIAQEMGDFLKSLKLGKIARNYNGYPFIMLFPKEVKYEKI